MKKPASRKCAGFFLPGEPLTGEIRQGFLAPERHLQVFRRITVYTGDRLPRYLSRFGLRGRPGRSLRFFPLIIWCPLTALQHNVSETYQNNIFVVGLMGAGKTTI